MRVVVVHTDGTRTTADVDDVFIVNADTWGDPPGRPDGTVLYIDPSAVAYFYIIEK